MMSGECCSVHTGAITIPENFRQFALKDKPFLDRFFQAAGYRLCEYSFAIQFCWHEYNDSAWAIVDDFLIIRYVVDGHYRFVCPVGTGPRCDVVVACLEYQMRHGSPARIDFVPDNPGCETIPGFFSVRDESNDDYVYLKSDLADLPGRNYSQKRNHIAALNRDHRWSVSMVRPGTGTDRLIGFARDWAEKRGMTTGSEIALELAAVERAITHAPELGLDVFVLEIDGGLAGMSICEKTLPDTYVVHFEKSDPDIRGAYQALCSRVAAMAPAECVFIDREQDMGVEGLRRTKHSWHPHRMEKCWTMFPV